MLTRFLITLYGLKQQIICSRRIEQHLTGYIPIPSPSGSFAVQNSASRDFVPVLAILTRHPVAALQTTRYSRLKNPIKNARPISRAGVF